MTKFAIDVLSLEVTRRCNMSPPCAHCFRGNAQAIDMTTTHIDNLLNQVTAIGELSFTGGEPLQNIPIIKYVYEKIKSNGIKVSHISLITNGLICPESFISVMKNFSRYMNPKHNTPHITIGVSLDKYHHNNSGKEFISKSTTAFSGWSIVISPHLTGMVPINTGNATALPVEETLNYFKQPYNIDSEIYCWEPCDILPKCLVIDPQECSYCHIITTPLYLSATGYLYNAAVCSNEYTYIDSFPAICNLNHNVDILCSIETYNIGRKTEVECYFENQSHKKAIDDVHEITDTFLRLNTAVQNKKYGLPNNVRLTAKNDMDSIIKIYSSEKNCNLCTAMMIWANRSNIVSLSDGYSTARNDVILQLRQHCTDIMKRA